MNMMQNTASVRLILAGQISVRCAWNRVYFSSNETSGSVFSLCLEVFIALYSLLAHMNCMREMLLCLCSVLKGKVERCEKL